MRTITITSLKLLALAAFPLFLCTSCHETKKAAAFDVTYNLPRIYFTYTSTLLKSGEVILYSGNDKINLDSILMAHDIPTGMITSAKLSQFSMTMTEPPDASFSWLQSMRFLVSADPSFNPNVELGNFVNNDPAAKTVNLTLNNVEMIPYMNNTTFYYRILASIQVVSLPSNMVTMFRDLQLKLHIEPL
jgi:hypothetical protein